MQSAHSKTAEAVVAAQLSFTYHPALQALFGTTAVPLSMGPVVIGTGVALFAMTP